MALTVNIPVEFGSAYTGKSATLNVRVYDRTAPTTNLAGGYTVTKTELTGKNDVAAYNVQIAGLADSFNPGHAEFDFSDDSTVRTTFADLTPHVLQAYLTQARAANLDAAISTRSTLTAAQVRTEMDSNSTKLDTNVGSRSSHSAADIWAVGARTLTAFGFTVDLSANALTAIWDKAVSGLTTVGSIGKLLADNINATISSRSSHTAANVRTEMDSNSTKLANLDAAITTRSSHSASDVWAVTTRAITDKAGFSLSSAGIQAIWDALTSALTSVGSIGKLFVDNLNATISSRMATFSYTAPDNTAITAIKLKTDLIPASPASEATLTTVATSIATILAAVDTEIAGIKLKTDLIPSSPAAVGSAMTLEAGAVSASALATDAVTEIVNAIIAFTVESGIDFQEALRLILAVSVGKLTGAATTTVAIRDIADTKNRIVATVDASGNRSVVTLDPS